jgi:ribosomal protein L21
MSNDNQGEYEKKDDKQAIMWLIETAKKGNAHAQIQLCKSYRTGWGVDSNLKQAVQWITKAVEQGYDEAKEELNLLEDAIRNKRVLSMGRTKVFISYSSKDKKYVEEMKPFLNALKRNHNIDTWYMSMLNTGDKWKEKIHEQMAVAKVAVLMVSQNFLDSDFIREVELPELLQAAEDEHATIMWIPVEACQVKSTIITGKKGSKICIKDYQAVCPTTKTLQSMNKTERTQTYNKLCEDIKCCFSI